MASKHTARKQVQFIFLACKIKQAYTGGAWRKRGSGVAARVSDRGAGEELFARGGKTIPDAASGEYLDPEARGVGGAAAFCARVGGAAADGRGATAAGVRGPDAEPARGNPQGNARAARARARAGCHRRERKLDPCAAAGAGGVSRAAPADSRAGAPRIFARRAARGAESSARSGRNFVLA